MKLTDEQVRDIRQYLYAHRWSGSKRAMAKKYGVSDSTISKIFTRDARNNPRKVRTMHRFVCDLCSEVFESDDKEEELTAEMVDIFGTKSLEQERASLCHPCWEKFMNWFNSKKN